MLNHGQWIIEWVSKTGDTAIAGCFFFDMGNAMKIDDDWGYFRRFVGLTPQL